MSSFLKDFNPENPMHIALNAYLSDAPESEKLAIVQKQWAPVVRFLAALDELPADSESSTIMAPSGRIAA